MTLSSQPLPTIGAANATEDSKIRSLLSELQGIVNGGIDSTNITDASVAEADLAAALTTRLGLTAAGRGKSVIATSETRSNTAYGTLTTPDKVTVTLPADGLIFVMYRAEWAESVTSAARAAIFVDTTQAPSYFADPDGLSTATAEATHQSGALYAPLVTNGTGLSGRGAGDSPASPFTIPTTGAILGFAAGGGATYSGVTAIEAGAGSHDVSIQFKSTSGSVTVVNRKLWVWTMGF